jgi:hypothetical protein
MALLDCDWSCSVLISVMTVDCSMATILLQGGNYELVSLS